MKKNTFLYIVIAVLVIALAGLGALNVRSLDKLASLQTKVNKLQKSVQEVSDSAAELSSKADQLDALYPDDPTVSSAAAAASSAEVQGPSAQEESTDTSAASDSSESSGSKDSSSSTQEEGTLSPSSGSTFTDNSDSSMDNLLNQVQSLLPTDNGTWSVYVCNLAKNTFFRHVLLFFPANILLISYQFLLSLPMKILLKQLAFLLKAKTAEIIFSTVR